MPAQAQSKMQIVRKEDKENRLRSFILAAIEAAPGHDHGLASRDAQLIVRSFDSPAVKAVTGLATELADAGFTLRLIITLLAGQSDAPAVGTIDIGRLHASVRQATSPRLADAHEQLVLGSDRVWIGDCMRRDPVKRDAFELFASDDTVAAMWAAKSFARLWQHAEPIELEPVAPPAVATAAAETIAQVVGAGGETSAVTVLTRH